MAIAPGGRHVATNMVNFSRSTQLIDAATGQLAHQFDARIEQGRMQNVAFSSDGQYLTTSETPQLIRVWDVRTGLQASGFGTKETFFGVNSLAAGPNGQSVAVGVNVSGRSAELIHLNRNDEAHRIPTQMNSVSEIAYSPDGRWIAAFASLTNVIRVWSATTGREEITLRGHPTAVKAVAFSHDGRQLAAGYADGRVVLWNLER